MNHGNEKHIKKDKSKVTISLAMEQICRNVYANNTTIMNIPTVAWYCFKLLDIPEYET